MNLKELRIFSKSRSMVLSAVAGLMVLFSAAGAQASSGVSSIPHLPAQSTLADLKPGWNQIDGGGQTICSRGTPYSFYVRPGKSDKLMIFFEGGGACWSATTCAKNSPLFKDAVTGKETDMTQAGIFNPDRPENPLKDYSVVLVPYCTGDIHTGSKAVDYGTGDSKFTIYHYGYINSKAVLDWAYKNYDAPKNVFLAGCSAGSYGSAFYTTDVMGHYSTIPVRQLGDAGVGATVAGWAGLDVWGFFENLPKLAEEFKNESKTGFSISRLYEVAGKKFPNNTVTEYTAAKDSVQSFFYGLMGGKSSDWTSIMESRLSTLQSSTPNFRSFVAGGDVHCILQRPEFYQYQAGGVTLRDWVANLVEGQTVQNAHCKDCEKPEPLAK